MKRISPIIICFAVLTTSLFADAVVNGVNQSQRDGIGVADASGWSAFAATQDIDGAKSDLTNIGYVILDGSTGLAGLYSDTPDGSDNTIVLIAGGGGLSSARGSAIGVYGNEAGGGVSVALGDVEGQQFQVNMSHSINFLMDTNRIDFDGLILTNISHYIPLGNGISDIGTPARQIRSLYVTGGTIYQDGVPLSGTNGIQPIATNSTVGVPTNAYMAVYVQTNGALHVGSLKIDGGLINAWSASTNAFLLTQDNTPDNNVTNYHTGSGVSLQANTAVLADEVIIKSQYDAGTGLVYVAFASGDMVLGTKINTESNRVNTALQRDGSVVATGSLNMGGYAITNVNSLSVTNGSGGVPVRSTLSGTNGAYWSSTTNEYWILFP